MLFVSFLPLRCSFVAHFPQFLPSSSLIFYTSPLYFCLITSFIFSSRTEFVTGSFSVSFSSLQSGSSMWMSRRCDV
jgi:hypothetical protein